jgi:glycerol-3-phosphate dehydrogenase
MRLAVIGGGINGLCCAWKMAQAGHRVSLFEKGQLMQATSSASSKLLHGGLRYLETGQIRLIREALKERDNWLARTPHLAHPLPILLPIYRSNRRPRWLLGLGLAAYDLLAGHTRLPKSVWLSTQEVLEKAPSLKSEGLLGGYLYHDGQMDDHELGLWVAHQCREIGVDLQENRPVEHVSTEGEVHFADHQTEAFDRVINVAGPWSGQLLSRSNIASAHALDPVRGSHLVVDRHCHHALLLEVPSDSRVFFMLPWKHKTLIGTTEVRQSLDEPIACSEAEISYLIDACNHYDSQPLQRYEILSTFSGLRPLLHSGDNFSRASREYAIQTNDKLLTVFGGKWTTAMALAQRVSNSIH